MIDRIDGCLTEWDALSRGFEAISVAKGWLLAVFLGGTLLASQVSRLGVVGKHFCGLVKNFTDGFVMKGGGNDLIARRLLK